MLSAWEGREKLPQGLTHDTECETYYRDWANGSFGLVRGSLACVPGDVVHLYHGTRQNRQYVERYKILHENTYEKLLKGLVFALKSWLRLRFTIRGQGISRPRTNHKAQSSFALSQAI